MAQTGINGHTLNQQTSLAITQSTMETKGDFQQQEVPDDVSDQKSTTGGMADIKKKKEVPAKQTNQNQTLEKLEVDFLLGMLLR